MPKISIILPTYNRAHLIKESINSVLAQTFQDFELIVIDDGSIDDTEEVLRQYKSKVQYHKIAHGGQANASNYGFSIAQGKFIACLDSDDCWEKDFLAKMYQKIQHNSQADFVYCDYQIFDNQEFVNKNNLKNEFKLNGNLFKKLLLGQFICTGAFLMKREVLETTNGYDSQFIVSLDWDWWLRISYVYEGVYVDEPLFKLRYHESNISHNPYLVPFYNLKVLDKIRVALPLAYKENKLAFKNKYFENHKRLAWYYRSKYQLTKALQHYLIAYGKYYF